MKINQEIKIIPKTYLIKDYMKERHLTQRQFALECGVSLSFMSKVLAGKTRYYSVQLGKVLDAAQISFTYYFDVEFLF